MKQKTSILFPCARAFAAGLYGRGLMLLAMQASLVLWPAAAQMARKFDEAEGVQSLLDTLSEQHRRAAPAGMPQKRFRAKAGPGRNAH